MWFKNNDRRVHDGEPSSQARFRKIQKRGANFRDEPTSLKVDDFSITLASTIIIPGEQDITLNSNFFSHINKVQISQKFCGFEKYGNRQSQQKKSPGKIFFLSSPFLTEKTHPTETQSRGAKQ